MIINQWQILRRKCIAVEGLEVMEAVDRHVVFAVFGCKGESYEKNQS
jgi:hypothetical protein